MWTRPLIRCLAQAVGQGSGKPAQQGGVKPRPRWQGDRLEVLRRPDPRTAARDDGCDEFRVAPGFGKDAQRMAFGQNAPDMRQLRRPRRCGVGQFDRAHHLQAVVIGEIAKRVVEHHEGPILHRCQPRCQFGVERLKCCLCGGGVGGVGCGVFGVLLRQLSGDGGQPGLGVGRVKPGVRVDRPAFDGARGAATLMQQRHRPGVFAQGRKRVLQRRGQFRPDPEHQIGPGQRPRLRWLHLEIMRVRPKRQQHHRRTQIAHHLRHQRLGGAEIGHHLRHFARRRGGKPGGPDHCHDMTYHNCPSLAFESVL